MAITDELGYQLAQARKLYVLDRFRNGAQAIQVAVRRTAVPLERAGSWVDVDLSWFPNTTTGFRHMLMRGQVIAIADLDCAWRRLLIEDEGPGAGYS